LYNQDDPSAPRVVVFQGSQPACSEAGLVLDAKGLAYELVGFDGHWALLTEPAAAQAARDELARYAAERSVVRRSPAAFVPLAGAGIGAGLYAFVLLITAYCAGIRAFGADWLARGSLDARAGGEGEWWRSVTALTLHLDQQHLLGNLLFGAAVGTLAARAFGAGIAWAGILAAGAAANYVDMLISPSPHRAVGASTAVFAALGLLVGFALRHELRLRERLKRAFGPLFAGVCLLALLGAGDEHVDVLGHALGFVCGIALGWIYSRAGIPRSRSPSLQWSAGAGALGLIAVAWLLALRR
jgi:membrane associated rhomboid family serine protease